MEVHPLAPVRKSVFTGGLPPKVTRYLHKVQEEWNRGLSLPLYEVGFFII